MFSFIVTEFHSDKINSCYRMTKCSCNKYFVSKFVVLGLRVHFDKVFIGHVIYRTA